MEIGKGEGNGNGRRDMGRDKGHIYRGAQQDSGYERVRKKKPWITRDILEFGDKRRDIRKVKITMKKTSKGIKKSRKRSGRKQKDAKKNGWKESAKRQRISME